MPGVRQKLASAPPLPIKWGKQTKHLPAFRRRSPTPTPVFGAYWQFAAERQRIFRQRLLGRDWATKDAVLQRYRFTNAYRASDRVSQYLITQVIYDRPRDWTDTFLRIVLFKLFNKIETWEDLETNLESIDNVTFDVDLYGAALDHIRERRGTLYSAAYIMPSASHFGSRRKHVNHLRLLQSMLDTRLPERVLECSTAREAFTQISGFPSIGPFLAYQLLTDLSYSGAITFKESDFVRAGPGALEGLHKCFDNPGDLEPDDLIHWTMDRQQMEFEQRGIAFDDLWGRPLQLIDCQNLYCEIGKYARAAFPEVRGKSRRTRIKQGFRARSEPISSWYPPKWGINERVRSWISRYKRVGQS